MNRISKALLLGLVAGALLPRPAPRRRNAPAAGERVRENGIYVQRLQQWIQKVNAEGKGVLQINFIGGPKAIPLSRRQRGEDRRGRHGVQHRGLLHQRDARGGLPQAVGDPWRSSARTAASTRSTRSGCEKANMRYLARMVENQPFHIYLNKKIDKPDLTGLKIRITPVYREFFAGLGANNVTTPPGEVLRRARAQRRRRLRLADRRHLRPQLAREDQVPRRSRLLRRRGVDGHEPAAPTRN